MSTASWRQRIRRTFILVTFLLFPLILNFFSPYIIIDGASQGVINGSFVTFVSLFVSSLFIGRLWCAWACPAAGLQEACFAINDRPARGGRLNWIKWGIWIPWVGLIVAMAVAAGGYRTINVLHLMDTTAPGEQVFRYVIYYTVVGVVFVLSLASGRRAFCHYGCWMAPFMILGRKLRNALKWPALRLVSDAAKCTRCGKCTKACPMSLDVTGMVRQGAMENSECILCASCVDGCPKAAIRYTFS